MAHVDIGLARRLARASALSYAAEGDIRSSQHFAATGLVDNEHLRLLQHSNARDAVLIGQTDNGVVAAFRGTLPPREIDPRKAWNVALDWINDLGVRQRPVPYVDGGVHEGFVGSLDNIWGECRLAEHLAGAMSGGRPLYITGHSKGGSLAALAAARLAKETGVSPAAVVTFGAPRTGDDVFARAYDAAFASHWRFEHRNDVVPHVPFGNLRLPFVARLRHLGFLSGPLSLVSKPFGFGYAPVGRLCFVDWDNRLVDDDTEDLAARRMRTLLTAGPMALLDHVYDKTMRPDGGNGYVEALDLV